jgi:hypothetical protein
MGFNSGLKRLKRLVEARDLRDTEMYLPITELCSANVTYFYQYSFYVAKIT